MWTSTNLTSTAYLQKISWDAVVSTSLITYQEAMNRSFPRLDLLNSPVKSRWSTLNVPHEPGKGMLEQFCNSRASPLHWFAMRKTEDKVHNFTFVNFISSTLQKRKSPTFSRRKGSLLPSVMLDERHTEVTKICKKHRFHSERLKEKPTSSLPFNGYHFAI